MNTFILLLSSFSTSTDANSEILGLTLPKRLGPKQATNIRELVQEDDVPMSFVGREHREHEALHQGSQDPASRYSHLSPAPLSPPFCQAQKVGAPEGAEVLV